MKKSILLSIQALGRLIRFIPFTIRKNSLFFLFLLESRNGKPQQALSNLFQVQDLLDKVINERALALGNGEHPKHTLTHYHNFFINSLSGCLRILDIGCGYGAVARSLSFSLPKSIVTGIDNDPLKIQQAISAINPINLNFQICDVYNFGDLGQFDGYVLSNVLEHLDDRVGLLKLIGNSSPNAKIAIRVPLYERHWTIPLRDMLGVNYFQDDDHRIEHKLRDFNEELSQANLRPIMQITLWGEIWTTCEFTK